MYEAAVARFSEDNGDDVEQKMQWFSEMLLMTHDQRQMIALDAERKNSNCVVENARRTGAPSPKNESR